MTPTPKTSTAAFPTDAPPKDAPPAGPEAALPLKVRQPSPQGDRQRPQRTPLRGALLWGAAALAGGAFASLSLPTLGAELSRLWSSSAATIQPAPTQPAAPTPTVLGLARLMPEGDLIRVSPPFGAGDARIAAILVSVGDRVAEGDLLATLDNTAALTSARLAAEAAVAQRAASLAQARETVRIAIL